MKKYVLFIMLIFSYCTIKNPTEFSEKALNDQLLTTDNTSIFFKEILKKHQGKKIVIDVWASWCADCIKSLPDLKKVQSKNKSVVFVFFSVDKNAISWKKGIQKYQLSGDHYLLPKGMSEGDLVDFIGLSWIPRYLVIDENGKIALFKSIDITEDAIINAINRK